MTSIYQYTIMFFIYVGWWLIPLVTLFVYKNRLNKYPINVWILEKRGDTLISTNDVAGRFNDPVNSYRLKKNKDTIPIPNYDWVLQYMYKPTNFFEKFVDLLSGKIGTIVLFKYSSKQYKPVKINVNGMIQEKLKLIRDSQGNPVYINIYTPIDVNKSMSALNFEVIDWDDINHMTQELRAIATRRSPIQTFLERWGAPILIMVAALILIIAGYYYSEMIKDAGSKAASIMGNKVEGQPLQNDTASAPNIPLISDIVNPT